MEVSNIYNSIIIMDNTAILDNNVYSIVHGKHSLWIPDINIKIPWTIDGKITPFRDWRLGLDVKAIENHTYNEKPGFDNETLISIINEYTIFNELNKLNMAPKIHSLIFIKTTVSDFYKNDIMYTDNTGIYGYIMDDANKLSNGDFTFYESEGSKYGHYQATFLPPKFELFFLNRLNISNTAIGDMKKMDNVINGFLIDVRRTLFDMMTLKNLDISEKEKIDTWTKLND